MRGVGEDGGSSVSYLDRTRGSRNSLPRYVAAGRKWLLAQTTRSAMANLRPGEVNYLCLTYGCLRCKPFPTHLILSAWAFNKNGSC